MQILKLFNFSLFFKYIYINSEDKKKIYSCQNICLLGIINFMRDYINNYILNSIKTKEEILNNESILNKIEKTVSIIVEAYKSKKKVLIAGNGGSAADAQHFSAELVSKFLKDRPALNSIALTTNSSILTAVGNDYNHDYIFARQIQAYGVEGDIYLAISTSGNSKNIIKSIEDAKKQGLIVIGLTGINPSKMDKLCDLIIKVPSEKTPIIQESHLMIEHLICALIEKALY